MINKYGSDVVERGLKKIGFSDDFVDNAVGKNKNVGDVIGVGSRKVHNTYSEYALAATKNPSSNKVVLGKYNRNGISYKKVAEDMKATYFNLDDWNKVEKILGPENMWSINKEFIDQQWSAGKEFYFSHNPWQADGFFEQEVLHLIDLGVQDFIQVEDKWKAVR